MEQLFENFRLFIP